MDYAEMKKRADQIRAAIAVHRENIDTKSLEERVAFIEKLLHLR